MTEAETFKLEQLRTRFTIDVKEPTDEALALVTLSDSWKFVAFTLDEALDSCLNCILKNAYRNDNAVITAYENGLKELGLNNA